MAEARSGSRSPSTKADGATLSRQRWGTWQAIVLLRFSVLARRSQSGHSVGVVDDFASPTRAASSSGRRADSGRLCLRCSVAP